MAKYITPCITLLEKDGSLDLKAQGRMFDHLIKGGVDGILILGSIGEFFAINMQQKKKLISFALEHIQQRVPVIVGTTSLIEEEILELSNYSLEQGADSVIIIPPYYFWYDQEGIYQYYDNLAKQVKGNIYIYNFPDRTGYAIAPKTVLALRESHENIIGVKDTIAGMDSTRELIKLIKPNYPNFEIYSGFDDNFARNVLSGGDGCIGGLSNVFPQLFSAWATAAEARDFVTLQATQQKVDLLMDIYKVGTPFVPYIKKAVQLTGVAVDEYASASMPTVTQSLCPSRKSRQ